MTIRRDWLWAVWVLAVTGCSTPPPARTEASLVCEYSNSNCADGSCCGNGTCDTCEGETWQTCIEDCPKSPVCGDGYADPLETCANCPQDIGSCNPTPDPDDGICHDGVVCDDDGYCMSCPVCDLPMNPGETLAAWEARCQIHLNECNADGICDEYETSLNCPQDCGPPYSPIVYGNGCCEKGEQEQLASMYPGSLYPLQNDCTSCGDGFCELGETPANCNVDCAFFGGGDRREDRMTRAEYCDLKRVPGHCADPRCMVTTVQWRFLHTNFDVRFTWGRGEHQGIGTQRIQFFEDGRRGLARSCPSTIGSITYIANHGRALSTREGEWQVRQKKTKRFDNFEVTRPGRTPKRTRSPTWTAA
jgi:hypothetical protein